MDDPLLPRFVLERSSNRPMRLCANRFGRLSILETGCRDSASPHSVPRLHPNHGDGISRGTVFESTTPDQDSVRKSMTIVHRGTLRISWSHLLGRCPCRALGIPDEPTPESHAPTAARRAKSLHEIVPRSLLRKGAPRRCDAPRWARMVSASLSIEARNRRSAKVRIRGARRGRLWKRDASSRTLHDSSAPRFCCGKLARFRHTAHPGKMLSSPIRGLHETRFALRFSHRISRPVT